MKIVVIGGTGLIGSKVVDELVGRVLRYDKDPRRVVMDPEARYFGEKPDERSLVPGPDAQLGSTTFDWWLTHVPPPQPRRAG